MEYLNARKGRAQASVFLERKMTLAPLMRSKNQPSFMFNRINCLSDADFVVMSSRIGAKILCRPLKPA